MICEIYEWIDDYHAAGISKDLNGQQHHNTSVVSEITSNVSRACMGTFIEVGSCRDDECA